MAVPAPCADSWVSVLQAGLCESSLQRACPEVVAVLLGRVHERERQCPAGGHGVLRGGDQSRVIVQPQILEQPQAHKHPQADPKLDM